MNTQTAHLTPLAERVLANLNEYPMSRAAVIPMVMKLTSHLNADPDDLARAISADPALSAAVLRLSNSSFYGRVRSVSSLREAVVILGISLLRSLVIATSVSSMFKGKSDKAEDILWRHSLCSGIAGRITAGRVARHLGEEAFLVGLVRDLAQLILLQRFKEDYQPVIDAISVPGADVVGIERATLGGTHEEIGAMILEQWNFPPRLIAAVSNHHNPGDADDSGDAPDRDTLTLQHISCFSDALADSLGHGFVQFSAEDLPDLESTVHLDLDADVIADIVKETHERFAEEQSLFEN